MKHVTTNIKWITVLFLSVLAFELKIQIEIFITKTQLFKIYQKFTEHPKSQNNEEQADKTYFEGIDQKRRVIEVFFFFRGEQRNIQAKEISKSYFFLLDDNIKDHTRLGSKTDTCGRRCQYGGFIG